MSMPPPSWLGAQASKPAGDCLPQIGCAGPAIIVIRAANFAGLRHEIGLRPAQNLAAAMAQRASAMVAADRITIAARDTIEIALANLESAEAITVMAALSHAMVEPLTIDGAVAMIDPILGGAVAVVPEVDELQLVEEAEAALADAVRTGAPAIRAIDRQAGKLDRAALSRDLVTAMRDGELLLHYQPKVHLRRRQVTSLEALIRWQHPTRGLIYPNDFIPLAEQTGDIAALTLWAIRRVITDHATLTSHDHDLPIFVNIAGILLTDDSFVQRACELIGEARVPIGFEITETSVIRDAAAAITNLQTFDTIGIAIAIDDYGAGLSSLSYLKQLPARELKIDKLFVTQLTSSHRDPLIVRSTIDLAHALEMEVVAEGVENHATLALLSVMGCDMAQGFFISRPLGLKPLLAFLEEHREGWAETTSTLPLALFARRG